jgi:hypothetical protein
MGLLLLIAGPAFAQTPEELLRGLSSENQAWVNRSCPRSYGPSLWSSCVRREINALARGLPDLSKVSSEQQAWIRRSCPDYGPSVTISCLNRELNAISRGIPDLSKLPKDQRDWIVRSCPDYGPSVTISCLNRELNASSAGRRQTEIAVEQPRVLPGPDSQRTYTIEGAHNDQLFIINGHTFKAQTHCSNMEQKDAVIFMEGGTPEQCRSAVIFNVRTREKCTIWCL